MGNIESNMLDSQKLTDLETRYQQVLAIFQSFALIEAGVCT